MPYGVVFLLGAAVSAAAAIGLVYRGAGSNRVLDAAVATLPGLLLIAVWLPIYLRDDLHALVAGNFSSRALLGLSVLVLPAAGFALWEKRQRKPLVASVGQHLRFRIGESLLAIAAAAGIWDLVIKSTAGDSPRSWIWLGVVPVAIALVFAIVGQPRIDLAHPWLRRLGMAVLIAPTGFAIATHFDNPMRHLIVTSGGAKILSLLLLSLTIYLGWLITKLASQISRERISTALAGHRSAAILISLMGIGLLQAASYMAVAMDDLGRYWTVADFLQKGLAYPVWTGSEGTAQAGIGEPWVDPPAFPLMILGSFAAAGHYFHSAQIPTFIANLFLPAAMFLAVRSVSAGRTIAFLAATLTVLFPPFQIHTLGASEPDSVFVLELVIGALFLVRASRVNAGLPDKLALGFLAALMALTRPEGMIYAGVFVLAVPLARRDLKSWLSPLIPAAAAIVFALFIAVTTDVFWSARSSGLSLGNFGSNLESLRLEVWPYYVRALLVDDVRAIVIVAIFGSAVAVGVAHLARADRVVLAVPAALAINVVASLSVNPVALRSYEPTEYFRHVSYGLPLLALLAAVGTDWILRSLRERGAAIKVALWMIALGLIGGELYLLSTPEEFYHGNTSGSLLRGGDIYVQALDLVRSPIELPCDVCEPILGGGFGGFRQRLFDHYAFYDMHSNTVGISYQAISAVFVFVGAVAAAATRLPRPLTANGSSMRSRQPVDSMP